MRPGPDSRSTQPERRAWSLGCKPGASSISRIGEAEAGQTRAGAETQQFFWELAVVGVEGGGSEKPEAPPATVERCGGSESNWSPGPAEGGEPDAFATGQRQTEFGGQGRTLAVWAQGTSALSAGMVGRPAWNATNVALNRGAFQPLGPPRPYHLHGMVSVSP